MNNFLDKFLRALYYAGCGLMVGFLANLVIAQSVWLEMRIHGHTSLWVLTLVAFIIGFLVKKPLPKATFWILEVLVFALYWIANSMHLMVYNIRDGLHLSWSYGQTANTLLVILLVINVLNLVIVLIQARSKSQQSNA